MISEDSKDSPDVISCPPLVYLGALGLGLLLDWLAPFQKFFSFPVTGWLLAFAGFCIGFWGVRTFIRFGTNVRPDLPVTALVTSGPYRYSRNPLYMACTIIYLGITLSVGSLWLLVMLIPTLAVVHYRIVRREEDYLESRFGESYRAYKTQVNRWI
ncbi:MAG TPA: isoprenylcysteine carboxylmethyltransferase family protein [Pseudomonadales bacterium]|nr:isoprenylcysteine carboxylmethyltransferase family protein [Pseudomonadales bacterium]